MTVYVVTCCASCAGQSVLGVFDSQSEAATYTRHLNDHRGEFWTCSVGVSEFALNTPVAFSAFDNLDDEDSTQ